MATPHFEDHRTQPEPSRHLAGQEARLFDYLDGRLDAGQAAVVEAHLQNCDECLSFCHQWQQLDCRLTRELETPALPPDFASRMLALTAEAPAKPATAQDLAAEEARWKRADRRFVRLQWVRLLDGIGYSAVAGVAALVLFQLAAGMTTAVGAGASGSVSRALLTAVTVFGGLVLAAGCGLAVRRPLARALANL